MRVPGRTRRWLRTPRTPPRTPHDRMVTLVDRMLELNKKKHSVLRGGIPPSRLDRLGREVATDREIDELVYELYGITDEERKIIEIA
jgi:hypothetical protein